MRQPCALVMAGGTGGHIFPGLAMAEALRARGWRVHWLGVPGSMEERLVPPRGFAFEPVEFGGVRGKGLRTLLALPLRLARALVQARGVIRRVQPDVVLGLGGYITVPGGLAARLAGVARVVNSITGLGFAMLADTPKARLIRPVVLALYRLALRGSQVLFQNEDNLQTLARFGVLQQANACVVPGDGIDTERFAPPAEHVPGRVVLMMGRLLASKGVAEYVAAARIVRLD